MTPKTEGQPIRQEIPPVESMVVSNNLALALTKAVESLPPGRRCLEEVNLLWAILQDEANKGKVVLEIMAGNKFKAFLTELEKARFETTSVQPAVKLSFDSNSLLLGSSVREILERIDSRGGTVETDQIILAEIAGQNSLVGELLQRAGVSGPVVSYPSQLAAIAKRVVYREEGSLNIGIEKMCVVEEVPQSLPAGEKSLKVQGKEQARQNFSSTKDLIVEARQGRLEGVLIRPKCIVDVLDTLESTGIVTIVADQEEIGDLIVAGVASSLAKDQGKAFLYQKLVAIDPVLLATNSQEAVLKGLASAKGGILYIPGLFRLGIMPQVQAAVLSGEVEVITSLTSSDWKKQQEKGELRNCRPIFVEAPNVSEVSSYLISKKEELENKFSTEKIKIRISPEALEEAIKLAYQYSQNLKESFLPFSAISLLNRAATLIKIRMSEEMKELHDARVKPDAQIDVDDVYLALEMLTSIEVRPPSPERYLHMEDEIRESIVGQDEAISKVSKAIRRAKAGLKDKRPIGSFIFMGPSGVGKTELAKALSGFLFGEGEPIQLNMSEYMERHNVARLIGAPPGYIGYEEGGQLTEAVRRKPYSVVVFDEIEKAHPDVWNMLLQIMEEGKLTDGHGRTVDFRNTVVIMTGNVGSEFYALQNKVGQDKVKEGVSAEIEATFRPEFLGRVDEVVIFNSLTPENIRQIVDIQIKKVNQELADQKLKIELSDEVKALLAKEGYDPRYGARPLRKVIQNEIEDQLSERILSKEFAPADTVEATLEDGKIVFNKKSA